jgi:lactose/cellobiose-specific phosphotransferase system IIC component
LLHDIAVNRFRPRPLAFLQALSGYRWLRAIRSSLQLALPVTFVGAMALMVSAFPFEVFRDPATTAFGNVLRDMVSPIIGASYGIMALCLVVLVTHFLVVEARERRVLEISPPLAVTVALVDFFLAVHLMGTIDGTFAFGPRSVLLAIVVAVFSAESFVFFSGIGRLTLGRKSYDFDPDLHLAVRAIVPAIMTIAAFLAACNVILLFSFNPTLWLARELLALNGVFESQLPGMILFQALGDALWFLGIHGPNVLEGVSHVLFYDPDRVRGAAEVAGSLIPLYVNIGGSGSTLGLLIAILFVARRGQAGRVAKYAALPSLFNINELVLFGLPIVFNPAYLIPFLVAPAVQLVLSYFCVRYGWVALDVVRVPWMTPPVIGGALSSGSWHGAALQMLNIGLSAAIYAPFVRFAERTKQEERTRDVRHNIGEIHTLQLQNLRVLNRHDVIGHTARRLLHEFLRDVGSSRVFLAYQPQHDQRGSIVGVEALLRWEHPQFGFIPPTVICSLAEEAKRIIPLGRWVIEQACRELKHWKKEGIENLRMSVNLSPLQLRDETLPDYVQGCLQANGLAPAELGLELTESQHVPDDPLSIATLKNLEALGIYLEMDDFGMGYSSMLYIRRFNFDAIKLDGSLTREVLLDNNCSDIIASVVLLGRAVGIRVVAEYVETQEQQAMLEELGCEVFQGYLYSAPLAGAPCLEYLRRHQCEGAAAQDERSALPQPA